MDLAGAEPPSEFIEQMHLAVEEESRLFELPLGATESDGRGGWVTYGPWDPSDCSRQLLAWFDAGLITLFVPAVGQPAAWNERGEFDRWLTPAEARQVLAEPERWTVESDDGLVCVVRTDAGMAPDAAWW